MKQHPITLGVDAGGTFTDFVCVEYRDAHSSAANTLDQAQRPQEGEGLEQEALEQEVSIRIHKTLSSPDAPERAILRGIREMGLEEALAAGRLHIVHGSTVATNAALEGRGARTAFVTNTGFADMLEIARQTRPSLYALEIPPAKVKVPRELCLEVGCRLAADGSEVEPLRDADIAALLDQLKALEPEAVAINLLFSFLAPATEERLQAAIEREMPEVLVSRSSLVLPEYKEYERGVATWLNASLGPIVYRYLSALQDEIGSSTLQIMQSSGESIAAAKASRSAVKLLLSGPAGGLTALHALGEQIDKPRFISFDMGGTSTDVALLDGAPMTTNEGSIADLPVGVAMVDMHTIGAGGGSVAFLDSGGMLQVGPRSAGASPGPVCYGQGGTEVTVTDAHAVLGHLDSDAPLAGGMALDVTAAQAAMARLGAAMGVEARAAAEGVLAVANEQIAAAIRLISVNRGFNPSEFMLTSFGGAGGLHVCALAEAMGMREALVPIHGGVLSALGMVVAKPGRQLSLTATAPLASLDADAIDGGLADLEARGRRELVEEGCESESLSVKRSVDLRYLGQSYTLTVPWTDHRQAEEDFVRLHGARFGYAHETALELVNLRVAVTARGVELTFPRNKYPAGEVYCREGAYPTIRREGLGAVPRPGPLVITELSATTFVAPGWCARLDALGNIVLKQVSD